jgi:murein DD-endopeptidase MepM/ murein hydrolase activator NlpD
VAEEGVSGSTGYSSGPHLHLPLKLAKTDIGFAAISLPFQFTSAARAVRAALRQHLVRNITVAAAASAKPASGLPRLERR